MIPKEATVQALELRRGPKPKTLNPKGLWGERMRPKGQGGLRGFRALSTRSRDWGLGFWGPFIKPKP